MGCCLSRPTGPNSPYPGGDPDRLARSNSPSPPETRPAVAQSGRRHHREQGPLDQHINRPLRRHVWTSTRRRWTRSELAKERADFFDTRVTGRSEVWQALHAALQVLWEPTEDEDSSDAAVGLSTAQSLLDAAEISLPTGDLVNGVYDALGNLYPLPEWVVSDPDNLLGDEDKKPDLSTGGEEDTAGEDGDDADLEDADKQRVEKGKGLVEKREMVNLRARLSDSGKDIVVSVQPSEKVRSIIKKIAAKTNASSKSIRIAYMGKMLKENASLEAQGWQAGHVVNAMVFCR